MSDGDGLAAIVLAGGRSRRMGSDKALLPIAGEAMLARVARIAGAAAAPVVVVAAAGQRLPALAAEVQVVRDAAPDRGPLEGLRAGLQALGERPAVPRLAFVCATDAPLIVPELPRRLHQLWHAQRAPALVVSVAGRVQPLLGVYAASLLADVEAQLATGDRSLRALVARVRGTIVDEAALLAGPALAAADPELHSLLGVNTPEELARAEALLATRTS